MKMHRTIGLLLLGASLLGGGSVARAAGDGQDAGLQQQKAARRAERLQGAPAAGERRAQRLQGGDAGTTASGAVRPGAVLRLQRLQQELNLTPDQRSRFREIVQKDEGEMRSLIAKMLEKRKALRDAVFGEPVDGQVVQQAAQELGALTTEITLARTRLFGQIRALLTPEQVESLRKLNQERGAEIDKWFEAPAAPAGGKGADKPARPGNALEARPV